MIFFKTNLISLTRLHDIVQNQYDFTHYIILKQHARKYKLIHCKRYDFSAFYISNGSSSLHVYSHYILYASEDPVNILAGVLTCGRFIKKRLLKERQRTIPPLGPILYRRRIAASHRQFVGPGHRLAGRHNCNRQAVQEVVDCPTVEQSFQPRQCTTESVESRQCSGQPQQQSEKPTRKEKQRLLYFFNIFSNGHT